MKIVHIVPGSGGTFYCQNCLRDGALVRALRRLGHDVVLAPMYLPLFTDDPDLTQGAPVFFGGVNVFLQERFSIFRRTPRWIDRLFDAQWLLRRAAAKEGSTSAAELGPMTLSMLQGLEGRQSKEFERLTRWLADHERPEVVHLSNALLSGLAKPLKEALGVPIVCSLQDEDTWIDVMDPPHAEGCWKAIAANASAIDLFTPVSQYYSNAMIERLGLAAGKLRVVPLGIDLDAVPSVAPMEGPPVLGFLSRLAESEGLGVLIDSFIELKKKPEWEALRLRATGGVTPVNETYVRGQRAKLARHGLENEAEFLPDFSGDARRGFLCSLSVLSVPALHGEAFGGFILEALAHGVPVVQPRVGGFTETVEATSGGLLYDPKEPGALERTVEELLRDPARARALGESGRRAVFERFGIEHMARNMIDVYEWLHRKDAVS